MARRNLIYCPRLRSRHLSFMGWGMLIRLLQLAVRVLQPCAHGVDTTMNLGDALGRGAIVFDRARARKKYNERSDRKAGEQACNYEHCLGHLGLVP